MPIIPLKSGVDVSAMLASVVPMDPSKYWYRRIAIAAPDVRRAVAAVGRLNPGEGLAWVVAPGLLVTTSASVATGSTVELLAGGSVRVRSVRRSNHDSDLALLEVDGQLPPPIVIARTSDPQSDIAVFGARRDPFLALGRMVQDPSKARLELDATLPDGALGAPILSLSLGEAIGTVGGNGAVIPSSRIVALAAELKVMLPSRPQRDAGDESGLERRVDPSEYDDRKGYDEEFIGIAVPMPKPKGPLERDILSFTTTSEGKATSLPYTHFSVVMSRSRRLSMFTAVNIFGRTLEDLPRGGDPWRLDPRIPDEAQFDNELYVDNDLDRGHMVRRLDPVWGDQAELANSDTFHYTNSCPQHKDLNQKIWNDLEEYIYQNTGKESLKVNVFTGPVFTDDDPPYRGAKIPLQFWKVVTMVRDDGELSATAYILSQADMIQGLEFVFGEFRTYQLPIVKLEELTHLDFGTLRDHDPKRRSAEGLESLTGTYTPITRREDVVIK